MTLTKKQQMTNRVLVYSILVMGLGSAVLSGYAKFSSRLSSKQVISIQNASTGGIVITVVLLLIYALYNIIIKKEDGKNHNRSPK